MPEPGAVYRWVWPVSGGAELHPGPALQWRAPETAGRYFVRFQVCTDLGGRRVGVLAEREIEVDVRPCGNSETQRNEPLRLGVVQRGQGAFELQALHPGPERVVAYAWDFGDGTRISLHWDGQADTVMRPWTEAVHVDEVLERGGFRGYVTVSASEASGDIKQILDFLYGHDARGKEVVVSWSPFKREAPATAPASPEPPPRK